MLCQQCKKNPVTVHFKSVVNGHATEWALCGACAQEKGLALLPEGGVPLSPAPFKSLSELIAQLVDEGGAGGQAHASVRCDRCGLTDHQFHVQGRFGCARCFEVFAPAVEPLLKHIHGHTRHAGKTPPRGTFTAEAGEAAPAEISRLTKELKKAVQEEDFERAAQIRDRLRRLKSP